MVEEIILKLQMSDIFLRLENDRIVSDSPRGAMTPEFVQLIRENREAIIEHLKQGQSIDRPLQASEINISKVSRDAGIPLSFSQQSLWFL
jgi:hypothetical protein